MNKPLLSVCLITYNQAQYIKEAIEGVLMQKVDFTWELIIADDCSTDGTREILLEYEKKFPNFIKLILQKNNIGPEKNWLDLMAYPKSTYVLYMEGDDYITDPCKFQKQVDFLEKNPDFSLCFHPVRVIYEDKSRPDEIFPSFEQRFKKDVLGLEDLLVHNFIQTNSVMYRWRFIEGEIKDIFPKDIMPGDWFLHLLHAQIGKIGFIDEIMAVYRRHQGSIFWEYNRDMDNLHLKYGIQELNFHKNACLMFTNNSNYYFETKILPFVRYLMNLFLNHKKFNELAELSKIYPDHYCFIMQEILRSEQELIKKNKEVQRKDAEIIQKDQEIKFIKSSNFWRLRGYYLKVKFILLIPIRIFKRHLIKK